MEHKPEDFKVKGKEVLRMGRIYIDLPIALHKRLKLMSVEKELSLKSLVEELITKALREKK